MGVISSFESFDLTHYKFTQDRVFTGELLPRFLLAQEQASRGCEHQGLIAGGIQEEGDGIFNDFNFLEMDKPVFRFEDGSEGFVDEDCGDDSRIHLVRVEGAVF